MEAQMEAKKVGRLRRGWELTKSSWAVLKLDKELAALPLISCVLSLLVLVSVVGIMLGIAGGPEALSDFANNGNRMAHYGVVLGLYFIMTFIGNFFGGAIIYGAVQRFRGGDPTIRSSVGGAWRKFVPLAMFSLLASTVGLLLQTLEERLPLAGKITAYIFDGAWNLATVFAVPVIVLSEENEQPLTAVRKSVGIIKKVWGESIVASFGIGLVGLLAFVLYSVVIGAGVAGLVAAGLSGSLIAIPVALGIIGLVILILIMSALGAIAKAALYHYATTGEAPGNFQRELLATAMTHKKARKIFG